MASLAVLVSNNEDKVIGGTIEKFKSTLLVPSVSQSVFSVSAKDLKVVYVRRDEIFPDWESQNYFENENAVVIVDGYILLNPDIQKGMAERIYIMFTENGLASINQCNGEYNIIIYLKKQSITYIINDRFASRQLYYYQSNKGFYVSTELKCILPFKERVLNNTGLMEYFLFFHNTGKDTIYKDIFALEPSSNLKISGNDDVEIQRYWELSFNSNKKGLKDLDEKVIDILLDGVKERLINKEKYGFGLSSGLDSRLVAFLIPEHLRSNVFVRTYGLKSSNDVQIAMAVAKRAGYMNHFVHEPKDVKFIDYLHKAVWRTEGQVPFWGLKSIIEHKKLQNDFYYSLPGHFADVLSGKSIRPFMLKPINSEQYIGDLFNRLFVLRNDMGFRNIFNPSFFQNEFDIVRDRFFEKTSNIAADNNVDLHTVWDLRNRQPRFTFVSGMVDNYLHETIKLFTDYHFVDAMLQLPVYMRFGQVFYKKMMATHFNYCRDIINGNTNVQLKRSIPGNYFDLMFALYHGKKRQKLRKSTKATNRYANTRQDIQLKNYLESFLNDSSFPSEIFSKKGLKNVIDEHYSASVDHNYLIGLVATFFASYELFILNSPDRIPLKAIPF